LTCFLSERKLLYTVNPNEAVGESLLGSSYSKFVQGAEPRSIHLVVARACKSWLSLRAVPEQSLYDADVGSALQQVGGEGMTKGARADPFCQAEPAGRHLDGLVDGGPPILSGQGIWEVDLAVAMYKFLLMQAPDPRQFEIHILYPEPNRLHDAQPTSIKRLDYELKGSLHDRNHGAASSLVMRTGTLSLLSPRTASMLPSRECLRTRPISIGPFCADGIIIAQST